MPQWRELNYQIRVMETLEAWLDYLRQEREEKPSSFVHDAWQLMKDKGWLPPSRAKTPYSPRFDGLGRPVPNATLKIPTGGGKTYLAAESVSRILSRYLMKQRGFVLWVVPNEAIYSQTLRHLKDREHPYRRVLDMASGNRTKIMTRFDPLHKRDVDAHLCVMVLMSQSIKRKNKETDLKFFRERGDVHGFMPPENNHQAHQQLLERVPNLRAYEKDDSQNDMFSLVKESMGNALALISPIIILDEAHKEMTPLAFETLYGFNPSFVLELSATPKDKDKHKANILVEVTGQELDAEGMIKLPLILEPHQETDWTATLRAGLQRLNGLQRKAIHYKAESNDYIRPIMLVRVERTGKEQRDGIHVHAEDVRDYLLEQGLDDAEIAIKTAEQNDLSMPENQDLLSFENRVRVIITKSALQEGWDCPFAYVLCSLAPSSSKDDMTQLVGRILRQPYAAKTGVQELDQCYVVSRTKEEQVANKKSSSSIFEFIKNGLEADGLVGVDVQLAGDEEEGFSENFENVQPKRRAKYRKRRIFLPEVKIMADGKLRNLDYETDILAAIDWRNYDPTSIAAQVPENQQVADSMMAQISLGDNDQVEARSIGFVNEDMVFDPVHVTQSINHVVLNPFIGREIVEKLIAALARRDISGERLGRLGQITATLLGKHLEEERDKKAEKLFQELVANNIIQFKLRTDANNYELLKAAEPSEQVAKGNDVFLTKGYGQAIEKSLLAPVISSGMNNPEKRIARYLDNVDAIGWWHRNVARRHYGIQGWQRHKVYPDFIFCSFDDEPNARLVVLESKGAQLEGNHDTEYKGRLLDRLTENFSWDTAPPSGEMELVQDDGRTVICKLLVDTDFEAEILSLIGVEGGDGLRPKPPKS